MQHDGAQLKRFARTGDMASLGPRATLSEIFHENTKLFPLGARVYGQEIARFNGSPLMRTLISGPYKLYSLGRTVSLPAVEPAGDLERTLAERRSGRVFGGEPLGRAELGRLLHHSYGVTNSTTGWRAVPSGGALFPLELYVVPLRVEGLEPGIYHYDTEHHALDVVERRELRDELEACVTFRGLEMEGAAAVLVVTAIFLRSTIKYQARGYRLVLYEAGAVGQSLSLVATAMGLESCLLGGFQDDRLSALLGIDGTHEAPLLPFVVGSRPPAGETSGDRAGGD